MPDTTSVLTALRNELELAGLVRRPAAAGALPPAHVEPRGGAPAPGDRRDGAADTETAGELVVTIRLGGEFPEDRTSSYRRRISVDVLYRSSTTAGLKAGRALDKAIRARLLERNDYSLGFVLGGPVNAGGIYVLEAGMFGGLGPVADVDGIRTERAAYTLETYAA